MAKNKTETKVNKFAAGAQDATHMLLPLGVLFEHPGNVARLYGEEALEGLEDRIVLDPRGIARHPLAVTPAINQEGKRLLVKDLCTEDGLKTSESLATYVKLHPEMKKSEAEAWFVTSGNQRLKVYRKHDMENAPVVAQEMTLLEQLRDLVNANNGQPLTRLEVGLFYLEEEKLVGKRGTGRNPSEGSKEGISTRSFAKQIGRSSSLVYDCVQAARIYRALSQEAQRMIERVNSGAERFTPDHLIALGAIPDIERRSEWVDLLIGSEEERDEKGNKTGKRRYHVKVTPTELKALIAVRVKGEDVQTAFRPVWGEMGIEDMISPEIMRAIESEPVAEETAEEAPGEVESPRAVTAPPAGKANGKKGKEQEKPLTKAQIAEQKRAQKQAQKEADRRAIEKAEQVKKAQAAKDGKAKKTVAESAPSKESLREKAITDLDGTFRTGLPTLLNRVGNAIVGNVEEGHITIEEGMEYRDRFLAVLDNYQGQIRAMFEGEQLSLGALVTAPVAGDAGAGPDGPEATAEEEVREPAAVA